MAPRILGSPGNPPLSEFLEHHGFSGPFVDHYLIPMTAAIWSTEPERVLDYPARTMASFLHNHGMLRCGTGRGGGSSRAARNATWRHSNGSLGERLRTSAPVVGVRRAEDRVEVSFAESETLAFDRVVLAVHSDQALDLLEDASDAEREILGAIPLPEERHGAAYGRTPLAFPSPRLASWNYHLSEESSLPTVTYYMNELQGLACERSYCVSLNRTAEIDPEKILHRVSFSHPLFTEEGIAAQERWSETDGRRRTSFCGAYWGYGFHEDGVASAVRVAEQLGVEW